MPEETTQIEQQPVSSASVLASIAGERERETVNGERNVESSGEESPDIESPDIDSGEESEHSTAESGEESPHSRDEDGQTGEEESDDLEAEVAGEGSPQPDPTLLEAVQGNEKAEKRLREITKGIAKLNATAKELKVQVEEFKPQAETLKMYNDAFMDPQRAVPAVEQLLRAIAAIHNVEPTRLLPSFIKETDAFGREIPDWQARGYETEGEGKLARLLEANNREIASLKAQMAQQAKAQEDSVRRADEIAEVERVSARTIAKLDKLENGWKVSKAMVAKALAEFPQLKSDPVRAVKACFADELKAHTARAVAKTQGRRGPEIPEGTRARGISLPDDRKQVTAADILAAIGS